MELDNDLLSKWTEAVNLPVGVVRELIEELQEARNTIRANEGLREEIDNLTTQLALNAAAS